MSIKAQLEALIYAAEDPITLDQMAALLKDDLLALKTAPEETQESLPQAEPALEQAEQSAQMDQAEDHLGAVEVATEPPVIETPAIETKAKKTKEKSEKAELRAHTEAISRRTDCRLHQPGARH